MRYVRIVCVHHNTTIRTDDDESATAVYLTVHVYDTSMMHYACRIVYMLQCVMIRYEYVTMTVLVK